MKKYIKYIASILICTIAAFVIYNVITINKEYYKDERNINIPIFVYHDIVAEESEIEYDYMQTTVNKYKEQILGLKKLGYHFITYDDLISYNKGEEALPRNSCIITFDDGYDGVYKFAYQISKEYNIPITSFVINNKVGEEGYFTWEEAKEMQKSGLVNISSHSKKHDNFGNKTANEAVEDVISSFEEIQEKTGSNLKVFTYPCGIYTKEEVERLKQEGIIQNLTDNMINKSSNLNIYSLHRCYPLNDSVPKILLKKLYREIRYN